MKTKRISIRARPDLFLARAGARAWQEPLCPGSAFRQKATPGPSKTRDKSARERFRLDNPTIREDNRGVSVWKNLLRENLYRTARPVFVFESGMIAGANLWTGARTYVNTFRESGIDRGRRVIIALPHGRSFLWSLLACLQEELSICPVPSTMDGRALHELATSLDATMIIGTEDARTPDGFIVGPAVPEGRLFLKAASGPATPEVRFLLATSGTTGRKRIAALTDTNVLSVLRSHQDALPTIETTRLSLLPWFHAFGLILELLPALLSRGTILRDPSGGRDPAWLLSMLQGNQEQLALNLVPLTARIILERDPDALRFVTGLVGGAPVSGDLAERLRNSRLRPGYGQTEAAPGIMTGEPGEWAACLLGRPRGCRVLVAEDGELKFAGDNAFAGYWENGGLKARADGFVATGDIVEEHDGRFFFKGRKSFSAKLANGRWFFPETLETELTGSLGTNHLLARATKTGRIEILVDRQETRKQLLELRDQRRFALAALVDAVRVVPAEQLTLDQKGMPIRSRGRRVAT